MSFQRQWEDLARPWNLPEDYYKEIQKAYSEPHRFYHNLVHADRVLSLTGFLYHRTGGKANRDALNFAALFHDIVYDTTRSDNEERSAELARELLQGTSFANLVFDLIMFTKGHDKPKGLEFEIMNDADLAILFADWAAYEKYAFNIRKEYKWVPLGDYATNRVAFLNKMQSRKIFYHMKPYLEDRAHYNLKREINLLSHAPLYVEHEGFQ